MIDILSYKTNLQGIKTFINKPVLWPVYEYTIAVKGLPSFGDNELETLILRLAEINIRDVNEIANCTGLEVDLVAFIQERLQHKGFLDDFMQLTENGLAKVSTDKNNADNVQYIKMYRDAVSGDMLSTILRDDSRKSLGYYQEPDSMLQEEGKTKFFIFKDLTTVGEEEIEGKKIAVFDSVIPASEASITSDDIKSVIKRNGINTDNCTFTPSDYGKQIYLAVVIMLQEGNTTDWISTDGFGNISPFFVSRFDQLKQQNQNYISELRRNKIVSDASFNYGHKDSTKEFLEWRAYPQIGRCLNEADELLTIIGNSNSNNSNEVEAIVQTKVNCIEKIYSLYEWIFFYKSYSEKEEIRAAIGNFLGDSTAHIAKIIGAEVLDVAYNKLKFNKVEENEKGYFEVPIGRIKHSLKEGDSHELFALFAANVLYARENDESWIYKIAKEKPDFMRLIIKLKSFRDSAAHAARAEGIDFLQLKQYLELAGKLINICYKKNKEIEFGKKKVIIYDLEKNNEQLKEMLWLETTFGLNISNALPDRLLGIAKKMALACCDSDGIQPVAVLHMSKLLEQCFAYLKQNANRIELNDSAWFDYAMRRASEAGFIANGEYKTLRNTKPSRIRNAVRGKDVTLQANFLAWLCTENQGDLKNIAKKCSYLVVHIDKVSELRAHDGIPEEELFKAARPELLQRRTVEFIKTLVSSEYFCNN